MLAVFARALPKMSFNDSFIFKFISFLYLDLYALEADAMIR